MRVELNRQQVYQCLCTTYCYQQVCPQDGSNVQEEEANLGDTQVQ